MVITDMGSDRYCLRWNNHQNNLLGVFSQLLQEESLVDVTLACSEGHSIRAHKVVLSACSSYFQSLFLDHPNRHPIIILKDVCFAELRTLIEFMYRGEVNLEYCQLPTFLKTAESLQVKGLAEMTHLPSNLSPDRDMLRAVRNEQATAQGELPSSVITTTATAVAHEPLPLIRRRSRSPTDPEASSERISGDVASQPTPPQRSPRTGALSVSPSRPPTASGLESLQSRSPSSRMPMSVSPHPADTSSVCDDQRSMSPDLDDDASSMQSGPSDMTVNSRVPSPCLKGNPGPSNFPPVQKVPLSLKKESNDWEKIEGRSSSRNNNGSDYSALRHLQDTDRDRGEFERQAVYTCTYCGATFPHQSKLTRHILSHSLETLKYRELSESHLPYSVHGQPAAITAVSAVGIIDHLSNPGEVEWGPVTRNNSFVELPHDSHSQDASSNESPGAVCKFCGKAFPDVSTLIGHLPAHTGDRPFKCEFCGKAFKLRHHMKDHCRVHTGERPFRCSLCGKTFSRSTILKAHEKTHYPKYVRKFLSSPSPEEEHRPPDLPTPCDLSMSENSVLEASTSAPSMFMHRPTPSPSP